MRKVCLDIGHGGADPGAIANGLIEKDLNLKVGQKIRDYLKTYDVQVILTREADKQLDPDIRVGIVNNFNPDLCVSIHHNYSGANARGAEVIHAYYDTQDDMLANSILTRLARAGMPIRRAFSKLDSTGKDWFYMIRRIWDTDTDVIIVEGGFLDNAKDAALLKSEYYLNAEAKAIADSIAEYLALAPRVTAAEQKVIDAINEMFNLGIINSPLYWIENAKKGKTVKGDFVGTLFVKFANAYKAIVAACGNQTV